MNQMWNVVLLTACALVVSGSASRGAGEVTTPRGPFVVIMGVGEFDDPAIRARPTAEADARAFFDFFAQQRFSFASPDRVILLTSSADEKRNARRATREAISKAIQEAVAKTGADDTIILAMFGRGASAGDRTCLLAADTQFKTRATTGLLGSDLGKDLKLAADRKLCVLLDIDFHGFDSGNEKVEEPTLRDLLSAVFGTDENRDGPLPPNRVMILSATPRNVPLAKGDRGLLADVALQALKGDADTEGGEPDGVIVVDELVQYVERTGAQQAREIGTTKQEKESIPFITGEDSSHFVLSKNPAVFATVEARLKALALLEAGGKIAKDVADEGRTLLSRMPRQKSLQELRKAFQSLVDGKLDAEKFAEQRQAIRERTILAGDAADDYVRKVMSAIEVLHRRYVKPKSVGEWGSMAIRGLYRRIELPIPEDIRNSLQMAPKLTRNELVSLLRQARISLGKRDDFEGGKDADITIQMMLTELRDPYTTYYDRDTLKKMDSRLRGEFRGVGIQVRRDLVRDCLSVASPIKGGPAYRAGIQAGDLITAIKRDVDSMGNPLKDASEREISTKGMKTDQAVEIILGKVGVPVTLVIERDGVVKEFTIKRELVMVESVLGVNRDEKDNWDFFIDAANKIGYVHLSQFTPTTAKDLQAAVAKMKSQGLNGLVLDLRFNPGGLLVSSVNVSDLFLPEKGAVVVTVEYRDRKPEVWHGRGNNVYTDFPMAVLINGQSASAAEIVSACLRDYKRAVVIGERSFGKGSVQNIQDFVATGGQIKMTTARYLPPSGRNIDRLSTEGKLDDIWGVMPDKGMEIKLSRSEMLTLAEMLRDREIIRPKGAKAEAPKPFEDKQLEAALNYIKARIAGN